MTSSKKKINLIEQIKSKAIGNPSFDVFIFLLKYAVFDQNSWVSW